MSALSAPSLKKPKEAKFNNGLKGTEEKNKLKKKSKVPSKNQDLLLSISGGDNDNSANYCELENNKVDKNEAKHKGKKKKSSEKKIKKEKKGKTAKQEGRNHSGENSSTWKPLAQNKCIKMVKSFIIYRKAFASVTLIAIVFNLFVVLFFRIIELFLYHTIHIR